MQRPGKIIIGLLSGFLLSSDARAVTPAPQDNPYQGIVDRNVFGLRPPTPPPTNAPPPAAPMGNVTLTGIFTIFGTKQTTMKVSYPAKPGQAAKEESYMLAEGERKDDIEIVQIDEKAGTVTIRNRGIEDTLDFLKNGAKPSAMPSPGPMPQVGQVSPFTLPPTAPSTLSGGAAITTIGGPNAKSIPTARNIRTGTMPGGASIPTPFNTTTTAGKTPVTPQLTPEEQIILMEIERERTKDAVKAGKLPPLPPTVLTLPPAPQ